MHPPNTGREFVYKVIDKKGLRANGEHGRIIHLAYGEQIPSLLIEKNLLTQDSINALIKMGRVQDINKKVIEKEVKSEVIQNKQNDNNEKPKKRSSKQKLKD